MADTTIYDLVVIGGGPAGYAAAIRAGQLGKKVACIERDNAGGTCLNWGCIPTKALLKSAEMYLQLGHLEELGLSCKDPKFDFGKIVGRSRNVADQMRKGIEFLFKKNHVDYFRGDAQVEIPGLTKILSGPDQGKFVNSHNTMIATGCSPRRLPNIPVDGQRVVTSREALVLEKLPASILVVGAGAIGVEFAYFFNAFGSKVTLVEMLPQILPVEDAEVSATLERSFKKQGINTLTSTKVENIQVGKDSVKAELVAADGKRTPIEVETLLLAIGVVPNLEKTLSDKVKIELDRGYVKVDDRYETTTKGIYAAGDIIGPPWLAHVATFRAVQAVNGMFGHGKPRMVKNVPGCTYCQPQVASIGLTEKAAKDKNIEFKVGKFPFTASGKAVAANHPEGFVKVISGEHGEILGAHIIGSEATELIAEYALAMSLEATAEDVHGTIHAHPTMSEALMEAAAAIEGEAIHI
jgi:dihydrolipoamide dehydrogenase